MKVSTAVIVLLALTVAVGWIGKSLSEPPEPAEGGPEGVHEDIALEATLEAFSEKISSTPSGHAQAQDTVSPPVEAVRGGQGSDPTLTPPTLLQDLHLLHPTFFPVRENFSTFAQPLQDALNADWTEIAIVWPDHPYGDVQRPGERVGDLLGPLDLDLIWEAPGVQEAYSDFMLAFTLQMRLKAIEQEAGQEHSALTDSLKKQKRSFALKIWSNTPHGEFLYEAGQRLRGR
jgi:hypothetical protein